MCYLTRENFKKVLYRKIFQKKILDNVYKVTKGYIQTNVYKNI